MRPNWRQIHHIDNIWDLQLCRSQNEVGEMESDYGPLKCHKSTDLSSAVGHSSHASRPLHSMAAFHLARNGNWRLLLRWSWNNFSPEVLRMERYTNSLHLSPQTLNGSRDHEMHAIPARKVSVSEQMLRTAMGHTSAHCCGRFYPYSLTYPWDSIHQLM